MQLDVFAVVKCADVAPSVLYSTDLTRYHLPDIFTVMNLSVLALSAVFCSGLQLGALIIYVYYSDSDTLYNEKGECV